MRVSSRASEESIKRKTAIRPNCKRKGTQRVQQRVPYPPSGALAAKLISRRPHRLCHTRAVNRPAWPFRPITHPPTHYNPSRTPPRLRLHLLSRLRKCAIYGCSALQYRLVATCELRPCIARSAGYCGSLLRTGKYEAVSRIVCDGRERRLIGASGVSCTSAVWGRACAANYCVLCMLASTLRVGACDAVGELVWAWSGGFGRLLRS